MNKSIIWIIVIIAIVVVGYMFWGTKSFDDAISTEGDVISNEMPVPGMGGIDEMMVEDMMDEDMMDEGMMGKDMMGTGVQVFNLAGKNFEFSVKEIRVKKGQTVRINFTNESGFHDWKIDEFNAATKQLQAGGGDSVAFVADKVGTFEYYCSVGSHRQMGMVGKLIVE